VLEQFTREWLRLYPQAKLLAASRDDLPKERRRAFVARAATNDWDAIVCSSDARSWP
jgi:N12 class adenine-specific DNA methylase